ncbi:MAG: phosphoribosylamine--glycine ligase [Methanomicrobiales archaeon]|nr:phosphoribosylamine--glycine ligase [Methanomicrobiales archaeon]NYT21509.1 phosphoribosylamine--glycine ligase [Methanomicrobiales archaeon]
MTMKVLVVGGGGREHAIARALSFNKETTIFSVMAKRNPGIAAVAEEILLEKETNVPAVLRFATSRGIDYTVIGPEAPLEAGIVDRLEEEGIGSMGPTVAAARLETDKGFCREMMETCGIAGCPRYRVAHTASDAEAFIRGYDGDLAIKPIGLTGGKGVRIMGEHLDRDGAIAYVRSLGGNVVLEERLIGEEFTLQAFVDGKHLVPMPLVQDHKRAFEGDQGPNTGGMGSYSMPDHSLPFVNRRDAEQAFAIMKNAVAAMGKAGFPYRGILYGQFMNTARGPMVIEFNARFGDPEAMNVLSLLESDLLTIIEKTVAGTLSQADVRFSNKATVCKYLVPEGYPDNPRTGEELKFAGKPEAITYYANIEERDGRLFTMTSRTLAFVGVSDSLDAAEEIAESAATSVSGRVRHRRDIGTSRLLEQRVSHMQELR